MSDVLALQLSSTGPAEPVDAYTSLLDVAKLLLSEEDADRTAATLVGRLVEVCDADRGFIVVREKGSFEQKFDVRYDRERVPEDERRFSRSLVRRAIEKRETIVSQDLLADTRFGEAESVALVGACSVLVAPLTVASEVYGVVYLDRVRPGGFPTDVVRFVADFAALAGHLLRRAIQREELQRRQSSLERDLFAQHDFQGIVTRDPPMLRLLETVALVAGTDATVLVQGETGTGKELVAHALHVNSSRRTRPLVTLHCTALPATILESELFGHVRGAFTGAERDRAGRIAAAHGGTLFLDEVGEIPLDVQAKLLRFLQFGELQRLGSDRVEKVDVRVVAATHRDLRALVEEGRFRRDLYFRLKVVELTVPPLRARKGDVPLLVDTFLRDKWKRHELPPPRFTAHATSLLEAWSWPGNVRELAHAVERACALARSSDLGVDLLPAELLGDLGDYVEHGPREAAGGERRADGDERRHGAAAVPAEGGTPGDGDPEAALVTADELERSREEAIAVAERRFLARLMKHAKGNVSQAARDAKLHRSYLQRLLAKHRGKF